MPLTENQIEQTSLSSGGRTAPDEPYLLTPGPLTTSLRTKQAMLHDWGSWDGDFNESTAEIRRRLTAMAHGGDDYDCVPMQGSGTFSMEAALSSFVPRDGKALVLMNGAYGQRAAKTLQYLGRAHVTLDKGDYLPPMPDEVDTILARDPEITDVVLIHCETSSGILNPLKGISDVVGRHGRRLMVDAMSSFGAVPLDAREVPFEVMVYRNLDLLDISPIQSVVKVDDTISGVGEALEAGCWGVGVARYSNYMDISSLEEEADLPEAEIDRRVAYTRDVLYKSGAHYVIDSIVELPEVIDDTTCTWPGARNHDGQIDLGTNGVN